MTEPTPSEHTPDQAHTNPNSDNHAGDSTHAGDVVADATGEATLAHAHESEVGPSSVVTIGAQPPAAVTIEVEAEQTQAAPVPSSWDEFDLPPSLRATVEAVGWTKPTPVQGRTFATMVAGTDVLVQSQTGSGKTGAFCLPWLAARFEIGPADITGVQLLVLLPTRELAKQVCDELGRLATDSPVDVLAVYGGTAMAPQLDALARGVHAVVGTPGRILDHIRRRSLDLSRVRTVVLDECDEMLSMGFLEDIRAILSACPRDRQTCLFSATVPRDIERIAGRNMRDPVRIELSGDEIAAAEIDHAFYSTMGTIKTRDLLDIIMVEDPSVSIVFCNTREETRLVANVLQKNGYSAHALSSDLTQTAREKVMGMFREHKLRFLVATDVAARGIDVSHVSHVINYSFPENAEIYVHRTGRTGRAGRAGQALSIVSPLELGSFYTLTKSYKSIHFTERKLPPSDELTAIRTEVKLDRISHDFSQPVSPEWLLLARRLAQDPRGERVIAYLLHEALEAERIRSRPQSEEDDEQQEPAPDDMREGARDRRPRERDRDRRPREREGGRDRGRDRGRSHEPRSHESRERASEPRERSVESRERGSEPRERGSEPRERGSEPRERGSEPRERSVESRERGSEPRERGSEPRERGSEPRRQESRERSVESRERGSEHRERGSEPRERGSEPRERGSEPRERAQSVEATVEGEQPRRRSRRRDHERGSERIVPESVAPIEGVDAAANFEDSEPKLGADVLEGETTESAEATADDAAQPKKRRRRRRRRGPGGPGKDVAAGGTEGAEADTVTGDQRSDGDGDGTTSDDGESEDEESDGEASESQAGESGESRSKRKRRRRRRRGGKPGEEVAAAPAPQPTRAQESSRRRHRQRRDSEPANQDPQPTPEPARVSQDDILIDIDETELTAVRDAFGEIDEFDELTLKGRRRAVLDDLSAELDVDVVDLTDRDAEDEDDESDDEGEGDGDDAGPASVETDSNGTESSTPAEFESDADAAEKKKRRRRRRRKKATPTLPELTCPPHKDFWEVWASKFSAADFKRDEDSGDDGSDDEDDLRADVRTESGESDGPEGHDSAERPDQHDASDDGDVPLIDAAPPEDALVRVDLNIGRRHGQKAAHVRSLLRRLTGLHGKAVKDLTVRDQNTLFRMDARHFEMVVARLDGSVVESVSLTLVSAQDDAAAPSAIASVEPAATQPDDSPAASVEPSVSDGGDSIPDEG